MRGDVAELAHCLACEAEAVCRYYLSNGRRAGNSWQVGDARNTKGRSMFVRLTGEPSGKRRPGKWIDAATGEHGDLLDVIRAACGLIHFHDVEEEARRFLNSPRPEPLPEHRSSPVASPESARRLLAISRPVPGTLVEVYLRHRGITHLEDIRALRFHPRCYYRPDGDGPTQALPAMIAAVTDLEGHVTGAHRTWLDPTGRDKAPVDTPRRAMGHLLGHAVRFGIADDVMAAGEGIETMLSLRCVMPGMPMNAALSAAHLAAILLPATLRRLYIVRDDDPAGDAATETLIARAEAAGIEPVTLSPRCGDFNGDLRRLSADALRLAIQPQMIPEDVGRFLRPGVSAGMR